MDLAEILYHSWASWVSLTITYTTTAAPTRRPSKGEEAASMSSKRYGFLRYHERFASALKDWAGQDRDPTLLMDSLLLSWRKRDCGSTRPLGLGSEIRAEVV
ncbi:hypothetical protein MMC11_003953 [Xylographa trunciseda]|nr:hypothetical protein [Xylographa trunciseda]